MKQGSLALLGLAMLLSTAACGVKPLPRVARQPDTTPVVSTPTQTPAAQPLTTRPGPTSQPPAENPRPTTLTGPERDRLETILARLVDALFDYDKSVIRQDATTALKDDVGVIRDILANYPKEKLLIEGHCDERGSEEYNVALGDRRALAAQEFLVNMGIPNTQLALVSYGKNRPVCTDDSEACWQKNRRAHVTLASSAR